MVVRELTEDPATYDEAINSEFGVQWKKAMDTEMSLLNKNMTWDLTTLPQDLEPLPCKWVYRLKKNPDGCIDYEQTFSPVQQW